MKLIYFTNVLASVLTCSVSLLYVAPENCVWTMRDVEREEVSLTCNFRTIASDFDSRNFTVSQSERVRELNIECSDVLFFQSSLEPRVFQRLYNLDSITIEYCKLTRLPAGAFLGLDGMKRLTVRSHNSDWSAMALELSSDSLVGMPHLDYLHLGQNNIWNLPTRVFCPLPALQHLNLTWNRLQDVSEVGVSGGCGAHLVTLDLSGNDLIVLPESGLAGLKSLRELYLQYNELSMLADGAFLGLTELSVLNISSNQLVALPPQVFNETQGLMELYVQNNSVSVIAPGLFSGLSQLTILDLSHNQLTSEWVTTDTFQGLLRLVVLNLGHNQLTQLTVDMFTDLSTLQVLDLSHNKLKLVTDMTFSSLANLHRLDLSNNKLLTVGARSLSGLHVLSSLSVSHNNISWIESGAFDNCTSLRDLRLDYNLLPEVPEAVREAVSLRTLRISHNQLGSVSEKDLTSLTALRHLDMSNNFLRGWCKSCLAGLVDLEVLDLSRNELGSVPHGAFDTNTNIQLLRMDGNKMSDINGLFASLSNLLWLNVSDNRITWFDYALIPNQLQYLDLHNNRIGDLGNYFSLQSKLELRTLDASHNHLEGLTSSSVPDSVELLFVNSNRITQISSNTFFEKNNLSMVDLYDNLLSKLDLNSISLTPVSEDRELPEFYIGGNPIFCDCNMEWLHRIHQISGLRQHPRVMDLDKVTCTIPYPRSGENRVPFLESRPSQFLCPYTSHCFALCKCCDFIACDCQMTCPRGCSCYHDETWATNIVDCSARSHQHLPEDIPMDATIVYMDNNEMPSLDAHQLIGRKNMMALYLNSSKIERIHNRTLHGLSSLKQLYLHDNMLVELKGYEFEPLEHLRELYLQNNRLRVINNASFVGLKALEVLRLDGNFLFNFPVWHFKVNRQLREVSLSVNLWSCQCQYMVNFKNWLIHKTDMVKDSKAIFCVSNSSGDPGPYVLESSYSCENFVAKSIVQELDNDYLQPVFITLGIFLVLILGVVFVVFRVRLKTSLSKKCGLKFFPSHPAPSRDKKNLMYDAFISYSELDAYFVTEVFASELENDDPSRKLCLAYRDNQNLDTFVEDFIINSIESSRNVIFILTKHFVDHDWCKFSFKVAHLEALKGLKSRVIVVTCDQVSEADMDSDLVAIVKNATRLKYEEESFWPRLHNALPVGGGGDGTDKTQQCYIIETNYILRNSLTPSHSISGKKQQQQHQENQYQCHQQQGVTNQLVPSLVVMPPPPPAFSNNTLKTTPTLPPSVSYCHQHPHHHHHHHHHHSTSTYHHSLPSRRNSSSRRSNKRGEEEEPLDHFVSSVVDTVPGPCSSSSLAPADLRHSYMSINHYDNADAATADHNSHIYASIDDESTAPALFLSSAPTVTTTTTSTSSTTPVPSSIHQQQHLGWPQYFPQHHQQHHYQAYNGQIVQLDQQQHHQQFFPRQLHIHDTQTQQLQQQQQQQQFLSQQLHSINTQPLEERLSYVP